MSEHTTHSTPQPSAEEWRDIPGYETLYQVSTLGNVRRLAQRIVTKRGHSQTHRATDKTAGLRNGYPYLWLFRDNQARKFYVHELVALAFLGPRPAGHDIHHLNENRLDNAVGNLTYISRPTHEALHHTGERHHSATLTESDVRLARSLYPTMRIADIARRLGKPYHAIWFAIQRRSWKHVP